MFLDIALGIGGMLVFSFLTGVEPTLSLMLFCSGCALLPDLDFVWHFLRRRPIDRHAHRHRELLHTPLLLLSLLFFVLFPFGVEYAILATLLTFAHFVHDSIGIGWGVRWLFPFRNDSFKFFENGSFLAVRTPTQVAEAAEARGDDDWFRNIYMRPSKTLLMEMAILGFAIGILLFVRWQS